MKIEFKFYCDGDFLSPEEQTIRSFMHKTGLLSPNTESRASFCGIINLGNTFYCFMPKTFNNRGDNKENARLLLSTIVMYAQNRGSTVALGDDPSASIIGTSPLLAIELLEDYLKHGLYYNTEPIIKKQTSGGKITWSHTISNFLPHLNKSKKPIYPDLLIRKLDYFSSSEVTAIHAAVISRLDQQFGWYFGDNNHAIAPKLHNTLLPFSREKCIGIIKKELSGVYSEREIHLLRNLLMYFQATGIGLQEESIVTGIRNFEHVWEDMCCVIYKDQSVNFNDQLPVPAYKYSNRYERAYSNRQNMDIIIYDDRTISVLDAKYYDFKNSKPSWPDLVKQFYYAETLKIFSKNRSVSSYFVIPKNNFSQPPEKVVVLSNENEVLSEPFTDINIISLDVEKVMRDYISNEIVEEYRNQVLKERSCQNFVVS